MSAVTCSYCGAESVTGRTACAECGKPLLLICPACGGRAPADQKFCGECGSPLRAASIGEESTGSQAATAPRVSPAGIAQAERRPVTAVFCDLVGFTPLSERLDPEEVREVQTAYFAAMAREIDRYGGIVEKYAGDAILALFGSPVVHEDDPERAVLCALGMQRAMRNVAQQVQRQYGVRVAMRVGANTGEVVSGAWDASEQQQSAVTGDVINAAARIQAVAEPGGVLVGEETMRLTRHRIRYGERQTLSLKGKTKPVAGYTVLGIKAGPVERWDQDASAAPASRPTPLVGRERELIAIVTAWQHASRGEAQLLTVSGEPGVGKSRLVAEALGRIASTSADPPRIVWSRCLSYGQSVSLWVIADLLRSVFSIAEEAELDEVRGRIAERTEQILSGCDEADRAIARDVLGEVLGLQPGRSIVSEAGPLIRRGALIRGLGLLLGSLTDAGPVVLVLEDVHWLDAASEAVLTRLLGQLVDRPLLILATWRPGGTSPWSDWERSASLSLQPLGEADAEQLAAAVLGDRALSADLATHVRGRAEGNPFFIEELLRYVEETGGLEEVAGEMRLRPGVAEKLPVTLAEVLLARLDHLEREVKSVAQVGSVIGRSFAVKLLARVLQQEEALLTPHLGALEGAGITYPRLAGEFEHVFRHVLLRDAAYGMLLRKRQRQLHLAVGEAIAALYPAVEYVEVIAYHFVRTEAHQEAAEWLERAGDRAFNTFANEAAIGHFQGSLDRLVAAGADELALARVEGRLGEALNRVARFPEAVDMLERAIAHCVASGQPERAAKAVADLAHALNQQGRLEDAQQRAVAMLEVLASMEPSREACQLHLVLSDIYQNSGRYAEMLATTEQMGELAAATHDQRLQGRAAERRGMALVLLGRAEEGGVALDEAIALLQQASDALGLGVSLTNLAEIRRLAGDLSESVRLSREALNILVRTGSARTLPSAHLNLAQLSLAIGEWQEAAEHIARAEEFARAAGNLAIIEAILPHAEGELALRRGDWVAARRLLEKALERAAGIFQQVVVLAQLDLSELDILEGRPRSAEGRLTGVDDEAEQVRTLALRAWARLDLGEARQALQLVGEAEREARKRHSVADLPEVLRIKGLVLHHLQRDEEAREALLEGRDLAHRMPIPFAEARILAELGRLDRAAGDEDAARANLSEALIIARRLGAGRDVELNERALAQLGH